MKARAIDLFTRATSAPKITKLGLAHEVNGGPFDSETRITKTNRVPPLMMTIEGMVSALFVDLPVGRYEYRESSQL